MNVSNVRPPKPSVLVRLLAVIVVFLLVLMFGVRWSQNRSDQRRAREATSSQQATQDQSSRGGDSTSDGATTKTPSGVADSSAPDPTSAGTATASVPNTGPGATVILLAILAGITTYAVLLRLQMRA